jgi:membrane protease YdiL (CAAX protease family)
LQGGSLLKQELKTHMGYHQLNVNKIFYDNNGRLRSGWRALIFLLVFGFPAYFLIAAAIIFLSLLPEGPSSSGYLPLLLPFSISTVIAIFAGWLCGRYLESVPFSALGCSFTKGGLRHLAAGLLIGAVAFGSAIIIAVMSGSLSLTLNHGSAASAITTTLLSTLAILAVGAASEETLFRGYLLQTFVRSNVAPVGIGLTALLFAFAHNANPNVGGIAWLNTFLAGIWFAAGYLKTRDLWFPFGIHLAWNWLQGPIFGINVSGIGEFSPDPLMRATDAGPAWLTGGAYGIEGGIACTFALVLSLVLIYYLPIKSAPPAVAGG